MNDVHTQTGVNDVARGACAAADVRCLVLDEAHKATGNHAYVQMVNSLNVANYPYRLLALSATPGNSCAALQVRACLRTPVMWVCTGAGRHTAH